MSGEDPGFDPSVISEGEVEKRRILEENMRRQIDKKMREQGKAKEEYSADEIHADPVLILLRDLDDDIGNLSDEVGLIQSQLKSLETKFDKLLESKQKDS